jgi:hypothetical protein
MQLPWIQEVFELFLKNILLTYVFNNDKGFWLGGKKVVSQYFSEYDWWQQTFNRLLLPRMNKKALQQFLVWLVGGTAMAALYGSYGCASIGSPTGGAKDTIAPTLVKALPENYTPNFKSKTITLNFDEYVELNSVFEKLIINPPLDKFPLIDRKLRTVNIRIKDTLEPNTTYSWRFDDVIRDVNEGNPLADFTYVFSTGPNFDSANFSGRVLDAETGKIDSTLIVMLHRDLSDTAVAKLKPRYVTKLDGKGFFRFTYLAPGTYNVFALKDEGMKRYTDSTMLFAFHDSTIVVSENTTPVEMLFFRAKEPESQVAGAPADPATPKPVGEEGDKKPRNLLIRNVSGPHDILEDLSLQLSSPAVSFDSSLVIFSDTLGKPITGYTIGPDTSGKHIVISHAWKLETWYQLIFKPGFATDSTGKTLAKEDTLRFQTKAERDYGALKMEFAGLDFEQNPLLQWMTAGKIVKTIPLTGPSYINKLFVPGDYEIRIVLDANKNGKWDTGDYWTKRQPERTLAITKRINIRGNWENEFTIDVNAKEDPDTEED